MLLYKIKITLTSCLLTHSSLEEISTRNDRNMQSENLSKGTTYDKNEGHQIKKKHFIAF
jgi:hypothetical protein